MGCQAREYNQGPVLSAQGHLGRNSGSYSAKKDRGRGYYGARAAAGRPEPEPARRRPSAPPAPAGGSEAAGQEGAK
ncbi:hypothetical protein IFR05_015763 [Cadophora sp. M221]|nr:hypothetical protein IFR05_015763 [Cadophora sp. M221]